MKIAVPSDDGSRMAEHTGQARGFIIYQAQGEAVERGESNQEAVRGSAPQRGDQLPVQQRAGHHRTLERRRQEALG